MLKFFMLMRRSRLSLYSLAAWIACWAVLAAALIPTAAVVRVSQAGPSFLSDICPAAGLKVATADTASGDGSAPKVKTSLEHCSYCVTHAGSFGLIPEYRFPLPLAAGISARPSLFYHAPHPLFA